MAKDCPRSHAPRGKGACDAPRRVGPCRGVGTRMSSAVSPLLVTADSTGLPLADGLQRRDPALIRFAPALLRQTAKRLVSLQEAIDELRIIRTDRNHLRRGMSFDGHDHGRLMAIPRILFEIGF